MMDEDDDERDDAPEPDEADRNDDPAEVACPYCKREIPEEAEQCPYCGCYVSAEDAPQKGRPWWWLVALVLVVLMLMGLLWR